MSEENHGNAPESGDQNQPQDQGANDAPDKGGNHMVPKARLDQATAKRREAEEALTSLADELIQDVPEGMRDLIPDLPPVEKVRWIRNATSKGLFAKPAPNGPDSKRPSGKPPTDFENMSPAAMREAGYK